jgi:hypothetical protein
VIELQNDGVSFSAVNARVTGEVGPHARLVLIPGLIPGHADSGDLLFPVSFVPAGLVFNEAALAPRVPKTELWTPEPKFIDRSLNAAPPAGPRLAIHIEQTFYHVPGAIFGVASAN